MHHHCHCPPAHHCHQPCPPPPPPPSFPPFQQQVFWNPAIIPAFRQGFYPYWRLPVPSCSSSSSDTDAGASCTVRVEVPAAAKTGDDDAAPLLEPKHDGAVAGPSSEDLFFTLLFWAIVAGIVYWCWFR